MRITHGGGDHKFLPHFEEHLVKIKILCKNDKILCKNDKILCKNYKILCKNYKMKVDNYLIYEYIKRYLICKPFLN